MISLLRRIPSTPREFRVSESETMRAGGAAPRAGPARRTGHRHRPPRGAAAGGRGRSRRRAAACTTADTVPRAASRSRQPAAAPAPAGGQVRYGKVTIHATAGGAASGIMTVRSHAPAFSAAVQS